MIKFKIYTWQKFKYLKWFFEWSQESAESKLSEDSVSLTKRWGLKGFWPVFDWPYDFLGKSSFLWKHELSSWLNLSFHKASRIGGVTASAGPAGNARNLKSRVSKIISGSRTDEGTARVANAARAGSVVAGAERVLAEQQFKWATICVDFDVRFQQIIGVLKFHNSKNKNKD